MTTHKLIKVLDFYDDYLWKQFGVPRQELPAAGYDTRNVPTLALQMHLRWMCRKAIELVGTGELDNLTKAHRWLGYVQGELRAMGLFGISELREHSRS